MLGFKMKIGQRHGLKIGRKSAQGMVGKGLRQPKFPLEASISYSNGANTECSRNAKAGLAGQQSSYIAASYGAAASKGQIDSSKKTSRIRYDRSRGD